MQKHQDDCEAALFVQVELPLGATEDRICGTINIEKALQEGIKAYEPGLLVSTCIFSPPFLHTRLSEHLSCYKLQGRLYHPMRT